VMSARGFGVAGAVEHDITIALARAAEKAGYSTYWVNDTPNGDGLAALAAAQRATTNIELGVGVVPIDRKPAAEIAAQLSDLNLDQDRLILGIGSGGLKKGALERVRAAAIELRSKCRARVVIGALGPKMCTAAGEVADGGLLNWVTPDQLEVSAELIESAASEAGRSEPWIGAYVRVAVEGPGISRLRAEAARYEQFPAYAAHFKRMGVRAIDTSAAGSPETIQRSLRGFTDRADEIVVRAIANEEALGAYHAVLHAAAPPVGRQT
jgi:alkanesulfonate monooxygenase SsuD/methylene tetrahydromethanopterin reductase-like flavin-dependent oxidoreductase (luciferase family)